MAPDEMVYGPPLNTHCTTLEGASDRADLDAPRLKRSHCAALSPWAGPSFDMGCRLGWLALRANVRLHNDIHHSSTSLLLPVLVEEERRLVVTHRRR